ncbi:MAG: FAD-binding protein, partial [Planctomycetes bacterium]|nr:FAD-binding protein [Planctomycetota bacterium]
MLFQQKTGEFVNVLAPATVLATGGAGQVYQITTNCRQNTGDGLAICAQSGIPIMDPEAVQFHPTGIVGPGILASETLRSVGGILRNKDLEPFMARYAPKMKDLAPRDLVSRAIELEIREGRGILNPDHQIEHVWIDLRHLPDRVHEEQIPEVAGFFKKFVNLDSRTDLCPVRPSVHYHMGGIPTNKYGEVVVDDKNTVFPGLYAAGEVACVSVHGANRLGTNSLLDLVVFGKHAGLRAAEYAKGADYVPLPADPSEFSREQFDRLKNGSGKENVFDIGNEMKSVMFDDVGVFRTEEGMKNALAKVNELQERFKQIKVQDTGKIFNTELLNAWEMDNLLDMAEVIAASALNRKESRGGHARDDYTERDDENWLKHTLVWKDNGKLKIGYKPVVMTRFEPKKRVY